MIVAGVDIGNSTTEISIARIDDQGYMHFLSSAEVETTGTKGTVENIKGIKEGIKKGMHTLSHHIDLIRINEATPVIGDTAMETITETIITDSAMVGHNPDTPAGQGVAIGKTVWIKDLVEIHHKEPVLVMVPKTIDYDLCARCINSAEQNVVGLILQRDEAVLVYNRLIKKIPIIDEVDGIDNLPANKNAAIEVAMSGMSIKTLSNPYGIAKVFDLTATETTSVIPIAKSLIGKKSALVVKNVDGGVKETKIKAGILTLQGVQGDCIELSVDGGAQKIMDGLQTLGELQDIQGEPGTHIGDMLYRMKESLSKMSEEGMSKLRVKDIMAIDTFVPVQVKGGLAGEVAMEKAVAIAAMVQTDHLPMRQLAKALEEQLNIPVKVAGIEAVMAAVGAMTTKGTQLPLAILDLGGGSTDAALLDENGEVRSVHLAGAGNLVTMLIDRELCLNNLVMAEWIKRYPLAKVNSLYHMTMENGEVIFHHKPLPANLYARVVVVTENELLPIVTDVSLERIVTTRREIKRKVFVANARRALEKIAPEKNIRNIPNVVILGGSALDQEIPEFIQQDLANENIVAGRGDIRSEMGPRNAVATGLVMSYLSEAFQ